MISVTPLSVAADMMIVELSKSPVESIRRWTPFLETATLLTICSLLNATIDDGISWEDAEWQ
jgi:hypothetical protein